MTENPNKVYEGEKNLENSDVHMKTELHISRNNTPSTLVNKNTNNNTKKIFLVSKAHLTLFGSDEVNTLEIFLLRRRHAVCTRKV
jgi:hypothetical protein